MSSSTSRAQMPTGRHEINIGSSLMRALKARKGGPVKNSKAKPDREFYSFRYNFKPESVDPTKPGSIEVKRPRDEAGPTSVNVVRPSTQNDHGVNFVGQEKAAREYDCVLIYDEELGTFTLEKIESCVTLHHDPRTVHVPRHANSPAPAAPQRITGSSSHAPREQSALARREEEESEGEIPESPKSKPPSRSLTAAPVPKAKPPAPASSHQLTPTPAPQSFSRSNPPSLPPKATQASAAASAPAPAKLKSRPVSASSSSTPSTTKSVNKRELPVEPEEEILELRRPAQPPPSKRQKLVPEKEKPKEQTKEPVALALPGSSSMPALALPSSSSKPSSAPAQPPALSLPSSSAAVSLPSVPDASVPAVTDSDEEEWDEVQPTITAASAGPAPSIDALAPRKIVMEEIEPSAFTPPRLDGEELEEVDIDMAALEEELKEQLADPEVEADGDADAEAEGEDVEDDFLVGAMSPVVERQPVSLSRFAGGGADFIDDDDYSSSDESDDD
ncbi:hypothetical protein BN946_scf185043.g168 [Trametes cinnabarina]|uniref:Transcription elongation factor Eaf N-terminal domain-containing protein n=1 Tax=Pycnoporus cinnabarinus TaxID=5643 RepID=A0A060SNT6_PYCCI|nr:hypothetical protein BN946_scf185043.g168 [Trametes cinnabarina]